MLEFLKNYFINRKLNSLAVNNKTLNIQKNLENPERIVVLFNENLSASKEVFSLSETLKLRYPLSKIEFAFFKYHSFYKEIFQGKSIYLDVPSPKNFEELDSARRIREEKNQVDMLFDMTTFNIKLRKMVLRTIRPSISISLFEPDAEEDFNILLKNSKPNWTTIYSSLNMKINEIPFKDGVSHMKEKTRGGDFEIVILGSSRKMKNEMKRAFKEHKKFLTLENISNQLDFFSFLSIRECKNVVHDPILDSEIKFIKSIEI